MPEQGQEGVFVLEDEWFVKTYRKIGDTIILSSLNRSYRDIEIELNDGVNFRCVGKVAGVFNLTKIYVTFYQCTIQAEAEVFHADEI